MAAALGSYPLEISVTVSSSPGKSVIPIATATVDIPVKLTAMPATSDEAKAVVDHGAHSETFKSEIAATLRAMADDLSPRPLRLAHELVIDGRRGVVTIDGQHFGFYLAAEPVNALLAGKSVGELSVVHLPVLVDPDGHIELINPEPEIKP